MMKMAMVTIMHSILTRKNHEDFLVYLYFGSDLDYLSNCINRAYLDLSRTLHGFGAFEGREDVKEETRIFLKSLLLDLQNEADKYLSHSLFDKWHQAACENLCEIYAKRGYKQFSTGQAQKWINMTFKYIFVLGEERITGFQDFYQFCHVPLDNIIIEKLASHHAPELPCAWSRINDYMTYLAYQHWVRKTFALAPLDVEFKLWMGQPLLETQVNNA